MGYHQVCSTPYGLCIVNVHDQYVCKGLMTAGAWCPHELELLKQVVPAGGVVVEAGANFGGHTLGLVRFVGEGGRVYAFEPQRIIFQALCGSIALNSLPNVIVRNAAVGAVAGTIRLPPLNYNAAANFGRLSLDGGPPAASSGEAGGEPGSDLGGESGEWEEIPLETIDDLSLARCDLVKADVEGMEIDVVRGATATIRRCRPILYLENHEGDRRATLIEACRSLGYDLYWHGTPHDPNMLCLPSERGVSVRGLQPVS